MSDEIRYTDENNKNMAITTHDIFGQDAAKTYHLSILLHSQNKVALKYTTDISLQYAKDIKKTQKKTIIIKN